MDDYRSHQINREIAPLCWLGDWKRAQSWRPKCPDETSPRETEARRRYMLENSVQYWWTHTNHLTCGEPCSICVQDLCTEGCSRIKGHAGYGLGATHSCTQCREVLILRTSQGSHRDIHDPLQNSNDYLQKGLTVEDLNVGYRFSGQFEAMNDTPEDRRYLEHRRSSRLMNMRTCSSAFRRKWAWREVQNARFLSFQQAEAASSDSSSDLAEAASTDRLTISHQHDDESEDGKYITHAVRAYEQMSPRRLVEGELTQEIGLGKYADHWKIVGQKTYEQTSDSGTMASSQSSSPPGWRSARMLRPVAAVFGDGNGSSVWPDGSSSATDATCDAHGTKWTLDCVACDNYADLHGERLKERARRFARNRSAGNPSCWKHRSPVSACVACQVWQHMMQQVITASPQRPRPSLPSPKQDLVMSEDLVEASPSKEEHIEEACEDPPTPKRHASEKAKTDSAPASDLLADSNPRTTPFTVWMDN